MLYYTAAFPVDTVDKLPLLWADLGSRKRIAGPIHDSTTKNLPTLTRYCVHRPGQGICKDEDEMPFDISSRRGGYGHIFSSWPCTPDRQKVQGWMATRMEIRNLTFFHWNYKTGDKKDPGRKRVLIISALTSPWRLGGCLQESSALWQPLGGLETQI
ncbi:hypothetical protein BJX62DRAFT_206646 [Aspergillus germanicus]